MANKDQPQRRVDARQKRIGGADILTGGGGDVAPPARPVPRAPTNLTAPAAVLTFSAVTPKCRVSIAWNAPTALSVEPDGYLAQWSLSNTFANPTSVAIGRSQTTADLFDIPTNTTVYIRLAALYRQEQSGWSNTTSIATPNDTAPPDPPADFAVTFLSDGSARISWSKPVSRNFRAVELRIFNSASKTVEYDLIAEADGTVYSWTASDNRRGSVGSPDGSPDPAIFAEARSLSWSGVYSTIVSASATKALPANVSGATATWDGATGTCMFRWNAVAGAVAYPLTIDGITRNVAIPEYVYTLTQNRQEHSGTADPSLTWSLVAKDALDQVSVVPATGTATLAPPATPTGVSHSWTSDDGTAAADWRITWNPVANIVGYVLTINGNTRRALETGYTYPLALNTQENGGTPDSTLTYSLTAVDALNQQSTTAASGTAMNAAPPAPSSATIQGFFSTLSLSAGVTTYPADFATFRYRLIQSGPSAADIVFDDLAALISRAVATAATYQIAVKVVDRFGQESAETLSAAVTADAITLEALRRDAQYTDSLGTNSTTLKAALADNNRTTGGIAYASGTTWKWTEIRRELTDRYEPMLITASAGQGYVSISNDGSTWSYYSGPLTGGLTLTAVANEAAGQAAAVTLPTTATGRWDLPTLQEARFVRLHHRNTGAGYNLREWYAERVVEGDLIRAGSIKALHIGGKTITGDQIAGLELSAIFASLGEVTIDPNGFLRSGQTAYNSGTGFWIGHSSGVPRLSIGNSSGNRLTWNGTTLDIYGAMNLTGVGTIGSGGGLYQGSGSFASPTTGLKLWNQSGVGRIASYNSGILQAGFDSDGEFIAAGGAIRLDEDGVNHIVPENTANYTAFRWWKSNGTTRIGEIRARGGGPLGNSNEISLAALTSSGASGTLILGGTDSSYASGNVMYLRSAGTGSLSGNFHFQDRPSSGLGEFDPWTSLWRVGNNNPFSSDTNMVEIVPHEWSDGATILFNAYSVGATGGLFASGNVKRAHGSAGAPFAAAGAFQWDGNHKRFVFAAGQDTGTRGANVSWTYLSGMSEEGTIFGAGTPIANQRVRILSHDNTSSSYPLSVINASSSSLMYVRGDGQAWVNQAWTIGSDRRLKDDIQPLADDPIAAIRDLTPASYVLKCDPGGRRRLGFVAQDLVDRGGLVASLVESCGTTEDDTMLGIDYTGITVLQTAAIHRLIARVEQLEELVRPVR
ncbi:MAG: hypothetical protein HC828_02095 [Blastochloris sp.]|nr:hypothetical protein [Blastochloris sp.]